MTRLRGIALPIGVVVLAAVTAACGTGGNTAGPAGSSSSSAPTSTSTSTTLAPSTPSTGGRANPPVTVTVKVWFLDRDHALTGQEPLFRPVDRQVEPPALAARALDGLFAGPTAAEGADGLELVTSGATGYTALHIESGIASVRLEGGCASNGSTMTIAGEIMPTLKQFASVHYVKIYAPDGTTESPTGSTDSIPVCLEP